MQAALMDRCALHEFEVGPATDGHLPENSDQDGDVP